MHITFRSDLITGSTGSGKSVLMQSILPGIAKARMPAIGCSALDVQNAQRSTLNAAFRGLPGGGIRGMKPA